MDDVESPVRRETGIAAGQIAADGNSGTPGMFYILHANIRRMTMMERRLLTEEEVNSARASLAGWVSTGKTLHREFEFTSFVEAFGFMTRVALIAESLNHHPEWSNVYGRVVMDLTTHDPGGISTLDLEFARRVSLLA
jgi:4a-hydroxytetrahydrobiopterin dehydratase